MRFRLADVAGHAPIEMMVLMEPCLENVVELLGFVNSPQPTWTSITAVIGKLYLM